MSKGWIGVDLDGTLAEYNGWKGPEFIGKPIPAMVKKVKQKLAEGVQVRIMTARVDGGEVALAMGDPNGEGCRNVEYVKSFIYAWCKRHIGQILPITNKKDYGMMELWDDRCKQVIPNTGEFLEDKYEELEKAMGALCEELMKK